MCSGLFPGAIRGQRFVWSPPQPSRQRAMKRLTPFSNILRIHGFSLVFFLYFRPWLLLTAASWLPRAARDSQAGPWADTGSPENAEAT